MIPSDMLYSVCENLQNPVSEIYNIVNKYRKQLDKFSFSEALYVSCLVGNYDAIIALLRLCEEVDANIQNWSGNSLLHAACVNDHFHIVKLLLSNGARNSINLKNIFGETPLDIALKDGSVKLIDILLEHNQN